MSKRTPTKLARIWMKLGVPVKDIARITGLHAGYVRKIKQRDEGRDQAWQRWRDNNPDKVRAWQRAQDQRPERAHR